jgi:hypothetical protein
MPLEHKFGVPLPTLHTQQVSTGLTALSEEKENKKQKKQE